jgi:hypothetical protein
VERGVIGKARLGDDAGEEHLLRGGRGPNPSPARGFAGEWRGPGGARAWSKAPDFGAAPKDQRITKGSGIGSSEVRSQTVLTVV